jgi:hypothetical protein
MRLTIFQPTAKQIKSPELAAKKLRHSAPRSRFYIPGKVRGTSVARIKASDDWIDDGGFQSKIVAADGIPMLWRRAYDVMTGKNHYRIDAWARRVPAKAWTSG